MKRNRRAVYRRATRRSPKYKTSRPALASKRRSTRARFARHRSWEHQPKSPALSAEFQWRPCCGGKIDRSEIKMVMVFLPGPATDFWRATAQVLLARCARDSMAPQTARARPRVKRK